MSNGTAGPSGPHGPVDESPEQESTDDKSEDVTPDFLIASKRYRTGVYHLPDPDHPQEPRCSNEGGSGRFPNASFQPLDADDPDVHAKDLCRLCDPDVHVERGSGGRSTRAKLRRMDWSDLELDSTDDQEVAR